MSYYQQINVATKADVGAPGPLPEFLVGLDDATLADLSSSLDASTMASPHLSALAGMGFVPVADPPPPAPRVISHYEFLSRIPQAKRVGIWTSTDGGVIDVRNMLLATNETVDLDDPQLVGGLGYLVAQSLLASDDVAAIRA